MYVDICTYVGLASLISVIDEQTLPEGLLTNKGWLYVIIHYK